MKPGSDLGGSSQRTVPPPTSLANAISTCNVRRCRLCVCPSLPLLFTSVKNITQHFSHSKEQFLI